MDKEQYQSQVVKLPKIRTNSAKTPIPVVKHIVKDEQDGKDELLQSQAFDIDKVVRLFVDPHCLGLVDRHLHGVRKICKYFPIGFLIKDVVKIIKILNVLSDKAENDTNYVDSICSLLRIFQYPFFKEKASDELFYEPVIVECIANIGYLFRTPNRSVREEICTCIYNLTTFKKIPSSASGELPPPFNSLERCSKAFVLNCVRNSDLAETLAKSLTLMEDDIEMRLKAMKILQLLSDDGRNCERMLNAECASRIVLKMNYSTPNEELLFRSVEIVWNLLENGNKEILVAQLNSLSAINQLRGAFLKQLFQGFSNYDRQLRNDILIISIELANIRPTLPFIQSGFAKDLLNFATYPEIKSNHPMMKNFKLSTCYEDFELKKLFFNFATAISKNETSYQLLSESGILLSLLSFIKPIEKTRESRDWTISQFEELQLLALSALCLLVPILLPDYITCHGNNRILVFLEWCAKEGDDYVGYGNSFHAKGGRGSRKAQLKYCLRLLRSLMTTNNEQAVQDLTDQGALDSLSSVLTPYCASEARIEQIDVEIMGDVFFILAIICEKDVHRKELFGNDGVEKLVDLLKKKPQFVWNGLGYQSMIIGCIDCLWATIVGCPLNEDYFIQKEGVFCLLDILEAAPKSIQNLTLGCLLDLSENPKTLTHLLQWEGKDNVKIAHFLCELWRIEERDNKVERDENGFIINTTQPLRSEDSDDIKTSLPAHEPSRAIVEISENMRAKIYGLFCKLGFSDLSGITNQDQMTLCIIENYLDFKLGEVFKEINLELELDEIRPITPDQEALENILRAADDRVVNVTMNQQNMARAFDEQETIQEKEFYYEIKKNFMSKEKKKEDWKEYVERVSKYTTLMDTKQRQLAAIEDSRPAERDPLPFETLHNLEIPNLAVTAFTGPFITIDSTPAEITGGRIGKILNK